MSLSTIIYLANISDNLQIFFIIIAILSIIVFIIGFNLIMECNAPPFKWMKIMGTIFVISIFLVVILPSKETVYTMIAANGVTDLAKTPEADKARKVLNLGLDKMINNLQESK